MKETLIDIRNKIASGAYKNEVHVRLQIVVRILSELKWEIWNPAEVNCEFNPVPHEDKTRVDIALFSNPRKPPDVFIETKPMGKIHSDLQKTETQLRDYNRDNTALFSIMTDGRVWRFYLSRAGGKFSEKCFKIIDLLGDDLDDIQISFSRFLQKAKFLEEAKAETEREAAGYLQLNEIQRDVGEALPQARKVSMEPPYPRLPEAVVSLLAADGRQISVEEAEKIIKELLEKGPKEILPETEVVSIEEQGPPTEERTLKPDSPPSLSFTKVVEARFGNQNVNNWNSLLKYAIKTAIQKHTSIEELKMLSMPVEPGQKYTKGYTPLAGTSISYQDVDANNAWLKTLTLAKKLNVEVRVRLRWREKENAAFPGQEAVLQWRP